MGPVPQHADIVARRREVLETLTAPKTKPEIVDSLTISRSTVDRAIDELSERGFVDRNESEYVTTYAGREALAAYEGFLDRLDALETAQPVLGALPADVDIPAAVLDGATVVESTPEAPASAVEANIDAVEGATRFFGTGPAVIPRYIDVVASLVEDGTETELVLTEPVVEALSETYPDGLATFDSLSGIDLYVTSQSAPYAVWTAENDQGTVSGIVVYGENGIVGIINNDTEAMHEWVRKEYDRHKSDAQRFA